MPFFFPFLRTWYLNNIALGASCSQIAHATFIPICPACLPLPSVRLRLCSGGGKVLPCSVVIPFFVKIDNCFSVIIFSASGAKKAMSHPLKPARTAKNRSSPLFLHSTISWRSLNGGMAIPQPHCRYGPFVLWLRFNRPAVRYPTAVGNLETSMSRF
jgi:hypothetical protein